MASDGAHIQRDWDQREFIEETSLYIKKITDFLNRFDTSTRYKLAVLNEKLTNLERQMEFLEASLKTVSGE